MASEQTNKGDQEEEQNSTHLTHLVPYKMLHRSIHFSKAH